MGKSQIRIRRFFKPKKRKTRENYIKNESLVHFINQHCKKQIIDFSKIKIPLFLDKYSEAEDSFTKQISSLPHFKGNILSIIKNEGKENGNHQFNIFKSNLFGDN